MATKVAFRAVLGVSTLGLSELNLANHRDELNMELKLEEYREHLTFQVNNNAITQTKAEELYLQHSSFLLQHVCTQQKRRIEPIVSTIKSILRAGLCVFTYCLSELVYRNVADKDNDCEIKVSGPLLKF